MMYLINKSSKVHHIIVYGSSYRKRLEPGAKMSFKGTRAEIEYYRKLASRGIYMHKVEEQQPVKPSQESVEEEVAKSFIASINLVGEKVSEQTAEQTDELGEPEISLEKEIEEVEEIEEEIEESNKPLIDDPDLSPGAVYSYDFLTKKKAIVILGARGIPYDTDSAAADLKNMVINSNP